MNPDERAAAAAQRQHPVDRGAAGQQRDPPRTILVSDTDRARDTAAPTADST